MIIIDYEVIFILNFSNTIKNARKDNKMQEINKMEDDLLIAKLEDKIKLKRFRKVNIFKLSNINKLPQKMYL